jgi:hypothetical protein
MYNLFVSGNDESWNGDPWNIEKGRCVYEYTSDALRDRYGNLDAAAIAELKRYPSVFAYEVGHELDPKFGMIRDVIVRQNDVRVAYELFDVDPFLSFEDLEKLRFELDIAKMEMYRTHWAVKDVDLTAVLNAQGIALPGWARHPGRGINIRTHVFDVALSFPGEERDLVEKIARELEHRLGPDKYFYDRNYPGQLARPNMDLLLQQIYGERSKIIIVFISGHYQLKDWCGIEFRAIRDIILRRDHDRIMLIRTGDGDVEGIRATDGYVDARRHSPEELAAFIEQRIEELQP